MPREVDVHPAGSTQAPHQTLVRDGIIWVGTVFSVDETINVVCPELYVKLY